MYQKPPKPNQAFIFTILQGRKREEYEVSSWDFGHFFGILGITGCKVLITQGLMLRCREIFPNRIVEGKKKIKSAQSENLTTRETWYQKHEAPKCRTLGFLCVCVFVCVLVLRQNGKLCCCGLGRGVGHLIWGHMFCCVLAFCSLCVPVKNRSLF